MRNLRDITPTSCIVHAEALRHGEHHLAPRDYPASSIREAVNIHLASSVCALSLIDPCDGPTLGPRISAYWGSSPLILPTRVCIGSGIAIGNSCTRIMSQTESESGVWEMRASGGQAAGERIRGLAHDKMRMPPGSFTHMRCLRWQPPC